MSRAPALGGELGVVAASAISVNTLCFLVGSGGQAAPVATFVTVPISSVPIG